MNFTKSILLFCLVFSANALIAQTADEVINKYFENTGGKSAWSKVKSMTSTSKIKAQGMEFPATMIQKQMRQKISFTLQGMNFVQPAFDGTTGWQTNFMTMKPEKMDAEDNELIKQECGDFPDALLVYKEKGYKLEMQENETVEGTDCFKIKLTKKPIMIDGKEEENATVYLFDKENFVPIMTRSVVKKGQAKGLTSETLFSDYQEVNGLILPFTIDQKFNGQTQASIVIEKIEFDKEIPESEFAFPESK